MHFIKNNYISSCFLLILCILSEISIISLSSQIAYAQSEGGECAAASIERHGYVTNDCRQIENRSQDICAAASIERHGYVTNDCSRLSEGGECAVASIKRHGYVTNDCGQIENRSQDICAAASIERHGYVTNDCLRL